TRLRGAKPFSACRKPGAPALRPRWCLPRSRTCGARRRDGSDVLRDRVALHVECARGTLGKPGRLSRKSKRSLVLDHAEQCFSRGNNVRWRTGPDVEAVGGALCEIGISFRESGLNNVKLPCFERKIISLNSSYSYPC